MVKRQPDIIETFQKTFLAERVNIKMNLKAVIGGDPVILEINRKPVTFCLTDPIEKIINGCFIKHDRQETVLEAIIEKNVSKGRSHDRAKAIVRKRPRSMLTR